MIKHIFKTDKGRISFITILSIILCIIWVELGKSQIALAAVMDCEVDWFPLILFSFISTIMIFILIFPFDEYLR